MPNCSDNSGTILIWHQNCTHTEPFLTTPKLFWLDTKLSLPLTKTILTVHRNYHLTPKLFLLYTENILTTPKRFWPDTETAQTAWIFGTLHWHYIDLIGAFMSLTDDSVSSWLPFDPFADLSAGIDLDLEFQDSCVHSEFVNWWEFGILYMVAPDYQCI